MAAIAAETCWWEDWD